MAFSDKAVETLEEDLLGRKGFAKRMAKDIIAWDKTDSLVIGLYAKWGDGKTSVVNFIKDLFSHPEKEGFEKEVEKEKIPTVIEFNPWIFSNQGSLIQNFLLEVGKELGQKDSEVDKEIARQLGLVKLYLSTINKINQKGILPAIRLILPAVGLSAAVLFDKLLSLSTTAYTIVLILILLAIGLTYVEKVVAFIEDFYSKRAGLGEKTLNQLKEDIKTTLNKRDRKILFIIDDIDRLTPDEVRNLFQLIKINLDLPNVIYLVVMDVGTVGKMISKDGINGHEYIEKIVQIPIPLPKADEKKLSAFLFAQLDELIKFFSENKWDKSRWSALYNAGLGKCFLRRGNLRIIKRPISQMASAASLISSEVDPVDFLGIRTLEHFHPDLYQYIADNKEEFTTLNHHRDWQSTKLNEIRKNVGAELAKVEPFLKDFLVELFPPLKSVLENYSMGEEIESRWRQERRICSPEYFDTYFFLDVPAGEMRTSEISKAITILESYEQFVSLLNDYIKDPTKDVRKFLARMLDYVDKFPINEQTARDILTALLNTIDDISRIKSHDVFDFGATTDVMRLIHFYLKSLTHKKIAVFKATLGAIQKTKSLYGATHLISLYSPRPGKEPMGGERIFTDDEAIELAKEGLKKINTAYKKRELKNQKELVYILYRWKEWGGEEDLKKFVESCKKSKAGLADFITKFKSISLSSSGGVTTETPRMQFKALGEFMDLEYVKKQVDKMDMKKLSKEQREAVALFKKDFSKKDDAWY